jgi:hypothetical protein
VQPIAIVRKGRGAVSNPAGRFERDAREQVDDGWPADDADTPPPPATVVEPDAARSITGQFIGVDGGFE